MDTIYYLFTPILAYVFRPLYQLVTSIGIYDNYMFTILLFTVLIRLVLLPSTINQQKGMAKQTRLQPKIKRIQDKYKNYQNRDKNQLIQQETQELYQREGYSSMTAGCLPLLIQMPVLTGLYGIIRFPLKYVLQISDTLIDKLTAPETFAQIGVEVRKGFEQLSVLNNLDKLQTLFPENAAEFAKMNELNFNIGSINLGNVPTMDALRNFGEASSAARWLLLIPLFSFLTSMLTGLITTLRQKKTNPQMGSMQMAGCSVLGMPLFSLMLTFQFPAGMGVYWIISNVLSFLQTLIIGQTHNPRKVIAQMMVEETVQRRSKENNTKIIRSHE